MTGNLGVHAYVIKRSCRDGGDDIARVGAGSRGRAEVATLTGRYRSDDEPDQDDKPTESHIYLRRTGGPYAAEEPRHIFVYPRHGRYTWSEARCAVNSAFRDTSTMPAIRFPGRCIVSADGPGWHDRAGRTCGTRTARPPTSAPAGRRRPMASPGS